MSAGPIRTCVACRSVRPKRELIRLVCGDDNRVRVDSTGRAPGRGAYVCRSPGCVKAVQNRGRLAHAFRKSCEAGIDLSEEVRGPWRRESR
ncbi:MAG: DUF448 domain-containing protein [Candidatus Rokuibacteriota bacterium]|nr:MAG: DUF448 domain-containing protein [Candidatus Rokubacteria bacterium]